jgi:hypothetical protein
MSSLDAARAPGAADDDDDDADDDDDDADADADAADPVTGAGLVVTPTVVLSHLVWEKHAQFIKPEVEPGSGIIVRVTHQLAAEGVRTEPAPFAAPSWGAPVHLAAPGHTELAVRCFFFLFFFYVFLSHEPTLGSAAGIHCFLPCATTTRRSFARRT